MSCGDGTLPLLGCKLSLISKAGIRYEGTLYTIDCKEATLTLADVRSFGTENRQVLPHVGPIDEIFNYIIFKGENIDEIILQEDVGVLNDPAIVQKSIQNEGNFQCHHGKQPFHSQGRNSLQSYGNYGNPTGHAIKSASPTGKTGGSHSGSATPNSMLSRKSPMIDQAIQVAKFNGRKNRFPQGYITRGRGARRGRAQVPISGRPFPSNNRIKFDGDYDFELANEKFEDLKNKLAGISIRQDLHEGNKNGNEENEVTKEDQLDEEIPIYYNKEKSFFDNISCEALEPNKIVQKVDWRRERKLNAETFGVSAYRRPSFRGRAGFGRFVHPNGFSDSITYNHRSAFHGYPRYSYRQSLVQK